MIYATPNGATATIVTRPNSSDGPITYGILTEDEYRLKGHRFSGVMVDIGAYIGAVGIGLAIENPDLRVVFVEALAANVDAIRANIAANGLTERTEIIEAAAGDGTPQEITFDYQHVDGEPDNYVIDNRYVGNMYAPGSHPMTAQTCTVPGLSLAAIVKHTGPVALLKLDCEGCEWAVLDSPAVALCDTIIGEFHGEPGFAGLQALLAATHDVVQVDDNPVNGIFWATRRG